MWRSSITPSPEYFPAFFLDTKSGSLHSMFTMAGQSRGDVLGPTAQSGPGTGESQRLRSGNVGHKRWQWARTYLPRLIAQPRIDSSVPFITWPNKASNPTAAI
jgi:hypothetical protein